MKTVYRYRLARYRGQILGWGIALALYALLMVQFYSTLLDEQEQFQQLIDSYPKEINVIAKVLWHKKAETERGMGCQFVHIPLFEKNIIIDYILRRYAEYQARFG